MKIIIIEDERIAAERLAEMLTDIDPNIEILALLSSIKESVEWLKDNKADLIFLDIHLSDGISFSIFDIVKISTPIIFTSAYEKYAIRAFQLNSIDYLLKPIRKTDLEAALEKINNLKDTLLSDYSEIAKGIREEKVYKKRFLVQVGSKLKNIKCSDIAYFFSSNKNVFFKCFDNSLYPVDLTLEALEKVLDPERFFRINRQYLINIDSIAGMTAWSRSRVKLNLTPSSEDSEVIVSVERAPDFKKWLDQ